MSTFEHIVRRERAESLYDHVENVRHKVYGYLDGQPVTVCGWDTHHQRERTNWCVNSASGYCRLRTHRAMPVCAACEL